MPRLIDEFPKKHNVVQDLESQGVPLTVIMSTQGQSVILPLYVKPQIHFSGNSGRVNVMVGPKSNLAGCVSPLTFDTVGCLSPC